jgi:hypothetical protein
MPSEQNWRRNFLAGNDSGDGGHDRDAPKSEARVSSRKTLLTMKCDERRRIDHILSHCKRPRTLRCDGARPKLKSSRADAWHKARIVRAIRGAPLQLG